MSDFLAEAIADAGVELSCKQTGPGAFHCCLKSRYGEMTRDITLRQGLTKAPDAGKLLYHFALKAQEAESSDDFADWADQTGRNVDDQAAKADYQRVCEDVAALRTLLGGYACENLIAALAIHQAISNARPG